MIIVWLPKADKTREALLAYIEKENMTAALEHGDQIDSQVKQLSAYPEMGKTGRKQGTRELVISRTSFVVIYRIKPKANRVEILRVLHSSQKWPLR